MHRLYRVARYPSGSTTKFVHLPCCNAHKEKIHRRNSVKRIVSLEENLKLKTSLKALPSRVLARNVSQFYIHPEKLKQFMKEKDGQNLCNYYDSDTYKKKAINNVEEQCRIISEGAPQNVKESDITYEHMLNCAQPNRKAKVIVLKKNEEEMNELMETLKQKRLKRSMVPQLLKKKKSFNTSGLLVTEPQIVYAHDPTEKKEGMNIMDLRRKYRKRTMILPLYLKKIQDNIAKKESGSNTDDSTATAQTFNFQHKVNIDNQMLNSRKQVFNDKIQLKKDEDANTERGTRQLWNIDYEKKLNLDRFKGKGKHMAYNEMNRHWYESRNTTKLKNLEKDMESMQLD